MKGTLGTFEEKGETTETTIKTGNLMLIIGVGALISVPIFKTVTHLPPYMAPKKWISIPELPFTLTGKINRAKLKELLSL
jgi:acyl-CoA synthetase (AMP-forming)/AMP-acid ligase II